MHFNVLHVDWIFPEQLVKNYAKMDMLKWTVKIWLVKFVSIQNGCISNS